MSSKCLDLLLKATFINNTNNSTLNISDNIIGEIWLEEDITSIFNVKYWKQTEFILGLIILILIGIITPFVMVYYYYPYYDKKQKLIKMKVDLNIESAPILKKDIIPYLNCYCNGNKDVIQTIFEFADITPYENMNEFLDSIMTSTLGQQSIFYQLCGLLMSCNLILLTYIPVYFITVHGEESYRSYVEIKCIPLHHSDSNNTQFLVPEYNLVVFKFDFNELCGDILQNYAIYGEFYTEHEDESCYINTNNYRKFRGNSECLGRCCCSTARCGMCCNESRCCASNACAYGWCLIFAIGIFILWLFIIPLWLPCTDSGNCGHCGSCGYYNIALLDQALETVTTSLLGVEMQSVHHS